MIHSIPWLWGEIGGRSVSPVIDLRRLPLDLLHRMPCRGRRDLGGIIHHFLKIVERHKLQRSDSQFLQLSQAGQKTEVISLLLLCHGPRHGKSPHMKFVTDHIPRSDPYPLGFPLITLISKTAVNRKNFPAPLLAGPDFPSHCPCGIGIQKELAVRLQKVTEFIPAKALHHHGIHVPDPFPSLQGNAADLFFVRQVIQPDGRVAALRLRGKGKLHVLCPSPGSKCGKTAVRYLHVLSLPVLDICNH